jgi:heat shock protein HslJ
VTRWLLAATAVVAFVAAAGCGDDDSGGGSTTGLEGTTWVLSPTADIGADLGDITVTARFDSGTVSGTSGCNTYTAGYEVDGSSLTIGPAASTRKACGPAATAVEDAYLGKLSDVASFEVDGDTLTLSDDSGDDLLVFDAVAGEDAIQGDWEAVQYYTGDAVQSVVTGSTLTATFDNGTISGSTGCNRFSGGYAIEGETITIGPLASTLAACENDELNQQEAAYLAALEAATSFSVAGSDLELLREDGGIAVTFTKG